MEWDLSSTTKTSSPLFRYLWKHGFIEKGIKVYTYLFDMVAVTYAVLTLFRF